MESIRLWLALTPKQFEDLNNGKEIQPDEYSKRFGLRKDPIAAVERAQYYSMIGRQKVPRVSSVPRIMSLLRSN